MWTETRNGKLIARERYKDQLTGKWKQISVTIEKDTKQERNKAARILRAKLERMDPQPSAMTLLQLKEAYISYQKNILKDSTVRRNDNILQIVVSIIGPEALCDRLSAGNIMRALLSTQKPPTSINTYLTRLKAMLRWGYKNDLCPDISGKLSMLPDASPRAKISDKFLEKKDLKKLIDGMEVEQWKNLSRLLALSGLRIGEALALEYDDISLKQRLIHVTKTLAPKTRTITPPKTADSVRDVYMQDELLRHCRKLLRTAKKTAMECGYKSSFVFCDHAGQPVTYDVYEKYLRENSERILGRRISSHVMRHTMTSLFAEAGVPLDTIARRLGHHDSKLTRDIYLHCTKTQIEKDQDAVREIKLFAH